jgi:hypothetical protein
MGLAQTVLLAIILCMMNVSRFSECLGYLLLVLPRFQLIDNSGQIIKALNALIRRLLYSYLNVTFS